MSRSLLTEKTQSLARVRAEIVELAASRTNLGEQVAKAADAARTAQVDAVIAPSRESQARAEAAGKMLEAAVAKRDAAEVRAEVLERAAQRLESEIRELDRDVIRASRAAAIFELGKRLDAGRDQARRWIIDAMAAEMMNGTVVTDAGLAAIQALEPKQHFGAVAQALSASASIIRDSIDRGEALP